MATRYRIYPSIGIARLGEDPDFFLGPEIPGVGPTELTQDGSLVRTTRFKDASKKKVRKQGARFHLFESSDGLSWKPAVLPNGATVTWSVTLINKKSAVKRGLEPPIATGRPQIVDAGQIIEGGTKTISGNDATSAPFMGTYKTTPPGGATFQVQVELGQLKTDGKGRLIVLGGKGLSRAPSGTPVGGPPNSYYKNPHWQDDIADGPVTAEVRIGAAAPVMAENGAWVIVGPPDYAPAIEGIVTLHDVMRQMAIDHFGMPAPGQPSFDLDIAPILARTRRMRWVHANANWSDARLDSPKLRSKLVADKPLRQGVAALVRSVEGILVGHTNINGPPFELRAFQTQWLAAWANGDFDDTAVAPATGISAEGLTRAALDGAVAQGFCPGIEAGIIVLDQTIYAAPFDYRIDQAGVGSGDLTALMAQPWQADFLKCNTEWWPSQRPDLAPQANGQPKDWQRGLVTHKDMVDKVARLGIIVQQGANEVFVEAERDMSLPNS
jgi:L-lysine epsilon oxidase-like protein